MQLLAKRKYNESFSAQDQNQIKPFKIDVSKQKMTDQFQPMFQSTNLPI